MHYKDISLIPNYSEVKSRSETDARMLMPVHNKEDRYFNSALIPANMVCTIDTKMARRLSDLGFFYVMHRFNHDQLEWVRNAQNWNLVSISLGVKQNDYDLVKSIMKERLRVDYITIDIAHGHHILMKNILDYIRNDLKMDCTIIAGNVTSITGARDLMAWGADVIKVGIGGGSACITKDQTGFTAPMYSAIRNIFGLHSKDWKCDKDPTNTLIKIPMIACGGAQSNGDVAKAIHAGAIGVMAGGMLAACIDAPGATIKEGNDIYKEYYGSASAKNKGENKHVEGIVKKIPCNGIKYIDFLHDTKQALQSSISYAGGKNLYDIRTAEWVYNRNFY